MHYFKNLFYLPQLGHDGTVCCEAFVPSKTLNSSALLSTPLTKTISWYIPSAVRGMPAVILVSDQVITFKSIDVCFHLLNMSWLEPCEVPNPDPKTVNFVPGVPERGNIDSIWGSEPIEGVVVGEGVGEGSNDCGKHPDITRRRTTTRNRRIKKQKIFFKFIVFPP